MTIRVETHSISRSKAIRLLAQYQFHRMTEHEKSNVLINWMVDEEDFEYPFLSPDVQQDLKNEELNETLPGYSQLILEGLISHYDRINNRAIALFIFKLTQTKIKVVGEPEETFTPCSACGYLTMPIPSEDNLYSICELCFWELGDSEALCYEKFKNNIDKVEALSESQVIAMFSYYDFLGNLTYVRGEFLSTQLRTHRYFREMYIHKSELK